MQKGGKKHDDWQTKFAITRLECRLHGLYGGILLRHFVSVGSRFLP